MNFKIKLLLVGKEGWLVEKIISRIVNSEHFNNKLFWFYSVDDGLLDFFYKQSSALIAMSIDEGFGLPLAEAASYGLPIIANDIPVFREVIGDNSFYLNASNENLVFNSFFSLLSESVFFIPHNFKSQLTWSESSDSLISEIDALMKIF
jgi:glycosyltransferase involved in cell wall biosynthesis